MASLVLWKRSRRAKLIDCVDVPSHGLDKIDQCGYIILKPENICLVDILSKSVGLGIPSAAGLTGCAGKDNGCRLHFLYLS